MMKTRVRVRKEQLWNKIKDFRVRRQNIWRKKRLNITRRKSDFYKKVVKYSGII